MGFLTTNDGTFSVFRVSVLIGVIGALLIGAGALSFYLDQEARRSPLSIDLPPNAEPWGEPEQRSNGRQFVYYQVPNGDINAVIRHYNQEMREHHGEPPLGQEAEECQRFPSVGEFTNLEAGEVPFYVRCLFEGSGINTLQNTLVTIQPGVFNEEDFFNTEGSVVIEYDQRWEP